MQLERLVGAMQSCEAHSKRLALLRGNLHIKFLTKLGVINIIDNHGRTIHHHRCRPGGFLLIGAVKAIVL